MATIYDALFLQALDLAPGEQIYIPCEYKQEQKKTEKVIKEAMTDWRAKCEAVRNELRPFRNWPELAEAVASCQAARAEVDRLLGEE